MRLPPSSLRWSFLATTALLLVLAGPTAAAAQDTPPSTVGGVLVPGETAPTTVAPPTTAAPATTAPAGGAEDGGGLLDLDLDANQKVWVIVGGLVVVAILIAVLTVLYWRHTKPDATPETRRSRRDERRRRRADRGDPVDEDRADEGPLDVDTLLGQPEPSRSVFAAGPDDPPGPAR